ncbi:MAG: B12-binding domain-containing radical SAM protein [Gemmatimonadaceae bacterium]|nr:B12-binding domain-containing radical SAM protein [Gemmatimonadaceae bacterium]
MPPTIALIGSEHEENLSLRYLAAAVAADGLRSEICPVNEPGDVERVVREVVALRPLLVGISVPFQMNAPHALALATRLREAGCTAHITVGGHFATFEYGHIMRDYPAIDSVVRHEGEETLRELCRRLQTGAPLAPLEGAVIRSTGDSTGDTSDGIVDGGKRRIPALDTLPFPDRRGPALQVMGINVAPILGSRGCYADCAFCCIYAYAENADGARYRRRSPENIVAEMKEEYDRRGVRLFVFHDDNFFVPSREQNLARYRRLKALIGEAGMTGIALVIKCRPNDVHRDLFELLKSMGLIRTYVGIETNSDEGIVSLNRRITSADNRRALQLFRELDIYHSFNVLIFDPEATMGGIARNLDFMAEFADVPFNFCRAEVYAGTPLKQILEHDARLVGDYFAWGYQMRDARVELLFRISVTAFASRNFKADGVANLNMGIRVDNEMVRHFHPDAWDTAWHERVRDFSRRVGEDSVAAMRTAYDFARTVALDDHAQVKAFTLALSRRVARADLAFLTECKALRREMERRVAAARGATHRVASGDVANALEGGRLPWAAETLRLGALRSSAGLDIATERLPMPLGITTDAARAERGVT